MADETLLSDLHGADRERREAAAFALASNGREDDVRAVLDVFDAPDAKNDSALLELVLHALSEHPHVAIGPLTDRVRRAPTSGAGRTAAAALAELAEDPEARHDPRVADALADAVLQSAGQSTWAAPEAVVALHRVAKDTSSQGMDRALAAVVDQAASEAEPYERVVRLSIEALRAHGRDDLLAPAAAHAPDDHPLHRLLDA
jgi:hypothetical protein